MSKEQFIKELETILNKFENEEHYEAIEWLENRIAIYKNLIT